MKICHTISSIARMAGVYFEEKEAWYAVFSVTPLKMTGFSLFLLCFLRV